MLSSVLSGSRHFAGGATHERTNTHARNPNRHLLCRRYTRHHLSPCRCPSFALPPTLSFSLCPSTVSRSSITSPPSFFLYSYNSCFVLRLPHLHSLFLFVTPFASFPTRFLLSLYLPFSGFLLPSRLFPPLPPLSRAKGAVRCRLAISLFFDGRPGAVGAGA